MRAEKAVEWVFFLSCYSYLMGSAEILVISELRLQL